MALTYGKSSPNDMLAKAERDLARLERAEAAQDEKAIGDALFDLAVSLTSLKDWLKEHPVSSFTPATVESYVAGSTALESFRDIANGDKHRVIRKYAPQTADVTVSVKSAVSIAIITADPTVKAMPSKSFPRLKIIRADGSRHRAMELGHDAVREWRTFMALHAVSP